MRGHVQRGTGERPTLSTIWRWGTGFTMKKITSITATLGAALLLTAAPALVRADDMQSGPVQIQGAQLFGQNIESEDSSGTVPSSVRISFTNNNDSPATHVVFGLVTDGAVMETIDDSGTFSKGVTINHLFPDTNPSVNQEFAVQTVTFADGSVWNNPAVPGAPADTDSASVSATNEF
jgi:hypothetical protein